MRSFMYILLAFWDFCTRIFFKHATILIDFSEERNGISTILHALHFCTRIFTKNATCFHILVLHVRIRIRIKSVTCFIDFVLTKTVMARLTLFVFIKIRN